MSSLRNALPRRAHKERAQPQARRKFGILEKHKDYVVRAKAYHKKEQTLQKLKEKAAFRNPDEFYFKMAKTRTVDGVHRPESEANKYTPEDLLLMKTQHMGYILQKVQSEKKKIERLAATLHSLDDQSSKRHVYYAEDREEAKEMQLKKSAQTPVSIDENLPDCVKRKRVRSGNFVKMRLSAQPANPCISGDQKGNGEEVKLVYLKKSGIGMMTLLGSCSVRLCKLQSTGALLDCGTVCL